MGVRLACVQRGTDVDPTGSSCSCPQSKAGPVSPPSRRDITQTQASMASGVSLDTRDIDSGRSSPDASSDSDAVNTSTSRVYFGPIQPAERRLARARGSLQQTPIRRPTRRHAGPSSLPMEILQSDEGEASSNEVIASDFSRPDTPALGEDAYEGEWPINATLCQLNCVL